MNDAVWTPRTFKIGQRVRIRLSPECACWEIRGIGGLRRAAQGWLGTIRGFESDFSSPAWPSWAASHDIIVDFDVIRNGWCAIYVAGVELAPPDEARP